MAATENNNATARQGREQEARQVPVYLPLIAGWLVPGAGHFLLRKWGRGALLAASIVGMFAVGLAMQGMLYSSATRFLTFSAWPAIWAMDCFTSLPSYWVWAPTRCG